MVINIEDNLVEFTPESSDETAKVDELWRLIIDCTRFNKKIVPVGAYIPGRTRQARFVIEDSI